MAKHTQHTVRGLLEMIGKRDEIAAECGVEPIAVYRWGVSGSIPSRHIAATVRVGKRNRAGITSDEIVQAIERERLAREGVDMSTFESPVSGLSSEVL